MTVYFLWTSTQRETPDWSDKCVRERKTNLSTWTFLSRLGSFSIKYWDRSLRDTPVWRARMTQTGWFSYYAINHSSKKQNQSNQNTPFKQIALSPSHTKSILYANTAPECFLQRWVCFLQRWVCFLQRWECFLHESLHNTGGRFRTMPKPFDRWPFFHGVRVRVAWSS